MKEKKSSNGGKSKNRKPWAAGSGTIWARRQTQPRVTWGLNYSSEKGQISLSGAEDPRT